MIRHGITYDRAPSSNNYEKNININKRYYNDRHLDKCCQRQPAEPESRIHFGTSNNYRPTNLSIYYHSL